MPTDPEFVTLPCVYCGALLSFPKDSPEGSGAFEVFCPDEECEDNYAATL